MESSILYQNAQSTVILIDIPRSLEAAQHLSPPSPSQPTSSSPSPSSSRRRIISTPALLHPYPSLEPKTPKARANFNQRLGVPSINELLLRKHVEFALREIGERYKGEEWCLGRVIEERNVNGVENSRRKRVRGDEDQRPEAADSAHPHPQDNNRQLGEEIMNPDGLFFTNPSPSQISLNIQFPDEQQPKQVHIPPHSTLLSGPLSSTLPTFTSSASSPSSTSKESSGFSLITLDPPWPNRSARRSSKYTLSPNISSLLSSLPLQNHLSEDGVIAVWVTNRESFREMLLGSEGECGDRGLFAHWGVQLAEEWVWVKTTVKGELVFDLEGGWRRPWEVLLVGRQHSEGSGQGEVKRRIIAGVPDLHSRKPNLKGLFEKLFFKEELRNGEDKVGEKTYEALEIFARNLTAGWWSWGDEVLKFQGKECWVDTEEG